MRTDTLAVPYFSQWETPAMTMPVVAHGSSALLDDPLWRESGAETAEEYAHWASNICGMACLKMVLAARGEIHRTIDLARACTAFGGYVVNEADRSIKGLIYAPFVTFVAETFGLKAETITNLPTSDLPALLQSRTFFMASVNSHIRWPDREPLTKGGHLVLITKASPDIIRFHNPSGHDRSSQANVALPVSKSSTASSPIAASPSRYRANDNPRGTVHHADHPFDCRHCPIREDAPAHRHPVRRVARRSMMSRSYRPPMSSTPSIPSDMM
jgi:hypothetical protein